MKSIIVALEPLPDVITLLTVWKRDFYSISQKSPVMRVCTLCVSLIVHGDLDGTHVFKTRLNELGSQETFLYSPTAASWRAVYPIHIPADNVITAILHLYWHKQPHHDAFLKTLYIEKDSIFYLDIFRYM